MKIMTFKQALPALFVVLSLAFMPVGVAKAEEAVQFPQAVVAIIDMQQIMSRSKAAKNINQQVEKHRDAVLKQLAEIEGDLREMEKEIEKQAKLLAPEALAEKRNAYEKRRLEGKKLVQTGRKIDAARNKSLADLQQKVALIVAEVAKTHGVTVVLPGDVILLADSNINITAEVMSILDKKITSVDVDMPTQ